VASNLYSVVLVGALVLFGIYRRLRRSIARQRVRPGRFGLRILLLGGVALALLVTTLGHPLTAGSEVAGLVLGGGLAAVGVTLTEFEREAEGLYFTPNRYLGLGVFALFVVRLATRMTALLPLFEGTDAASQVSGSGARPSGGGTYGHLAHHPWTIAIFGLFIGYYVCYYGAVVVVGRREGTGI